MSTQTHVLKLPRLTLTAKITEEQTRILIDFSGGESVTFDDMKTISQDIAKWSRSVAEAYKNDPRSIFLKHIDGTRLAIIKVSGVVVAVISGAMAELAKVIHDS